MENISAITSAGLTLVQVAWVVKDIKLTKQFFRDVMGINNLSETDTIRAKDYEGTYYGKPSDGESLVSMAYSGGTFLELIQPLTGNSIFRDYLDKNPSGGIQHLAYSLPVTKIDK